MELMIEDNVLNKIKKLPIEIEKQIFDFIPLSIKYQINKAYFQEYIKTPKFRKKITIEYIKWLIKNNETFILEEILIVYGNHFKQITNFYHSSIRYKTFYDFIRTMLKKVKKQ